MVLSIALASVHLPFDKGNFGPERNEDIHKCTYTYMILGCTNVA
jgi:hypothetical protein